MLKSYCKRWMLVIMIGLLLYGAGYSFALQIKGKETLSFLAKLPSDQEAGQAISRF